MGKYFNWKNGTLLFGSGSDSKYENLYSTLESAGSPLANDYIGTSEQGILGGFTDALAKSLFGEGAGSLNLGQSLKSWLDSMSGSELTNAQKQQNEFNANEAQINRDFQAQQAELAYERQVDFYEQYQSIGAQMRQYQESGLNPALMFGNGASVSSSAPSSSFPSGSAASGSQSSNPMAFVSFVMQLAGLKANIEKTKAETKKISEDTNLTAQQVLTERERTAEVKALAAEVGQRTTIALQRWNQETTKIAEEIEAIKASKDLDVAKKEEAIAQQAYNEARASYEKWKTDTASLRYWTSTGAYALSASLRNLADIGLSISRITQIFKGKLQKGLKLPTDEINLPNDGTGYQPPKRKTREDEFIEEMVSIFDGLNLPE